MGEAQNNAGAEDPDLAAHYATHPGPNVGGDLGALGVSGQPGTVGESPDVGVFGK